MQNEKKAVNDNVENQMIFTILVLFLRRKFSFMLNLDVHFFLFSPVKQHYSKLVFEIISVVLYAVYAKSLTWATFIATVSRINMKYFM